MAIGDLSIIRVLSERAFWATGSGMLGFRFWCQIMEKTFRAVLKL
jgi:hypothetical protein